MNAPDSPAPSRPITVLIAALGGEGGGVLTDWIITAASNLGLPVQSTSIPGVAQRTGATTYYIEIYPKPWRELDGRRPVLALAPGIGDVDMVVASELLEAGRAIAGGFVTPDRTLLIASTHRSHAIAEKMAMGDGRFDTGRLVAAIEKNARAHVLFDMDAAAKTAGAMINAVMLGAIAASGRLPIPVEAFEGAIQADGKAVNANLRGFKASIDAARQSPMAPARDDAAKRHRQADDGPPSLAALEADAVRFGAARDIVVEGVRRLVAYQDTAYAALYVERLGPIAEADARAGADGRLVRETARHLAVRMSYEDVIRVAQAKIAPDRMAKIIAEIGAKPGEPVAVVEFLKPGIEEMCSILPPWLATRIHRVCGASRLNRPLPLGHGDQDPRGVGLSAVVHAGEAPSFPAAEPSLRAGAGRHRGLARGRSNGGGEIRRACPRSRGMFAAGQGLWRYAQARRRELCHDRDEGNPAGPRRHDCDRPRRRCDRKRPNRGTGRPRRRKPRQMPRRDR